jgi:hypothetical protein
MEKPGQIIISFIDLTFWLYFQNISIQSVYCLQKGEKVIGRKVEIRVIKMLSYHQRFDWMP